MDKIRIILTIREDISFSFELLWPKNGSRITINVLSTNLRITYSMRVFSEILIMARTTDIYIIYRYINYYRGLTGISIFRF